MARTASATWWCGLLFALVAVPCAAQTHAPLEEPVAALPASALRSRALDYGLPDPDLFVRAGRAVPPGLTATRTAERRRLRDEALERLRGELAEGSATRLDWLGALRAILERAKPGSELWAMAADVVGRLGLYELEPGLLRGLDPAAPARMRAAAERALAALYGAPPPADATPESFRPPFEPGPGTRYLLELLREREREANALRTAALERSPERAERALADRASAVRAAAARVLGMAVSEGVWDAERARAALADRLDVELSTEAFHALVEALLVCTRTGGPGGGPVEELREQLVGLTARAPNEFALSLALGLARLPWSADGSPAEHGVGAGLRHLAGLLQRLSRDELGDEDVIVGVLAAQRELLAAAGVAPSLRATTDLRAPLLELLERSAFSESVRISAAVALEPLAAHEDGPRLRAVLDAEGSSPALRRAVLGTVGALALEGARGGQDVRELVAALVDHAADADADVRRRALEHLSQTDLAERIEAADWTQLVERLEAEPVVALRRAVLALIRLQGDPSTLDALLAAETFDGLIGGDPARAAELAEVLAELAGDDSARRMQCARRLARSGDHATRNTSRIHALRLIAGLPPDAAASLTADDHRAIVEWARTLASDGGTLASLPEGRKLLERILDLHLPRSRSGVAPGARSSHALALVSAELVRLGRDDLRVQALEAFDRALTSADGAALGPRVRRDRARFALQVDARDLALGDYQALFDDAETGDDLLELADLRGFAELRAARTDADPARCAAAFDVLDRLVRRSEWRNEPGAVRMQDLRDLVERALCSADERCLRRAAELLEQLPDPASGGGGEPGDPPEPGSIDVAVWDGLELEPQGLTELRDLRASLEAVLAPKLDGGEAGS